MPWTSRWKVDVPDLTLPSYVFQSPTAELSETPLLLDADRADKYWLSHKTFRSWCQRFAAGLIKAGLKPGDRVLLFSGNTLFFPVVFMGVIMAGGIFTGANPTYVPRELAYQLRDSGAQVLITSEAGMATSLEAAESISLSKDRIFLFDAGYDTFDGKGQGSDGIRHWSHLIATPCEGENFAWKDARLPEDVHQTICLNYSSGTTGVPKGVMITHRNYVSNTAQVIHNSHLLPDYESLKKESRWLCFLPMYHAYGQTYFCVGAAVRGVPTYIMQKSVEPRPASATARKMQ